MLMNYIHINLTKSLIIFGALQSPVLLRNKQNALSISAVRGLGESYTVVEISLIQVNQ
jgi:hypothetical protein